MVGRDLKIDSSQVRAIYDTRNDSKRNNISELQKKLKDYRMTNNIIFNNFKTF